DELLAARGGRVGRLRHLLDPPALHLEPPVVGDVVGRGWLARRGPEVQELVHGLGHAAVPVVECLYLLGCTAEGGATEQVSCVLEIPGRHEGSSASGGWGVARY